MPGARSASIFKQAGSGSWDARGDDDDVGKNLVVASNGMKWEARWRWGDGEMGRGEDTIVLVGEILGLPVDDVPSTKG